MKKCNCSDRPLMILGSRYITEEGVAWQELQYGCSNRECPKYKVPAVRVKISLADRKTTVEEEI